MSTDGYSPRYLRFVLVPWHIEEFETAYLAPDARSSRNVLERLRREYQTLPPRHVCTCRCPNEARGWPACAECRRLRAASVRDDIPAEMGRTSPSEAPLPMVLLLDLHTAVSAIRAQRRHPDPIVLARYLSGPDAA